LALEEKFKLIKEANAKALDPIQQAVAFDPRFGGAQIGEAYIYADQTYNGWAAPGTDSAADWLRRRAGARRRSRRRQRGTDGRHSQRAALRRADRARRGVRGTCAPPRSGVD
jgi:hypothetical protein